MAEPRAKKKTRRKKPKATDAQRAEAMALAASSIPETSQMTIKQIAEEAGVSRDVADKMLGAMNRQLLELKQAMNGVTRNDLRDLFQFRAFQMLSSITEQDIAKAPMRDKVLSAAIATDKSLLLDGQPTEIYSFKELQAIEQVMPVLLAEAARRGMMPVRNEETGTVSMEKQIGVGERGDPTRNTWAPSDEPPGV